MLLFCQNDVFIKSFRFFWPLTSKEIGKFSSIFCGLLRIYDLHQVVINYWIVIISCSLWDWKSFQSCLNIIGQGAHSTTVKNAYAHVQVILYLCLDFISFPNIFSKWFRIFFSHQSIVLFSWDSQQDRLRTTSMLVRAFWNFKLKVLNYPRNCIFHNILIPNSVKPLMYIVSMYFESIVWKT